MAGPLIYFGGLRLIRRPNQMQHPMVGLILHKRPLHLRRQFLKCRSDLVEHRLLLSRQRPNFPNI